MAAQGDIQGRAGDIVSALALLTRLPLPPQDRPRGAEAAWAWPLAGLAVGLVAVLAGGVAQLFGLTDTLVAGVVLAGLILCTGALHEDGLADVADGFWGGQSPAGRLTIMKDSRIGSYGVIALILSLLLRWAALVALIPTGGWAWPVLTAAILSRAPMAVMSRAMPNARGSGLSDRVGQTSLSLAAAACGLSLVLALLFSGWAALLAVIWAGAAFLICAAVARAKIGGQTGDVLGATQQLCEIAVLGALVAAS